MSEQIEIDVVGKRCVYINNYRVAGGKPWHSENLPRHQFTVTIKDVLDAFNVTQIQAYLDAKKEPKP